MVRAEGIAERDKIGNDWADEMAEKGSALSNPPVDAVVQTHKTYRMARYFQERLAQAPFIHTHGGRGSAPKAIPPIKVQERVLRPST